MSSSWGLRCPIGLTTPWAVAKGNDALLALVNDFLRKQYDSGNMEKLQVQWLGKSFQDLPREPLLPGDRPMPK